jgi:hypothetical protein
MEDIRFDNACQRIILALTGDDGKISKTSGTTVNKIDSEELTMTRIHCFGKRFYMDNGP